MIDFRYHLVSIIAVFLALAVGIVLGSGPLTGPIDAALNNRVDTLEQQKEQLRRDNAALKSRLDYSEEVGRLWSPTLVQGRLGGRSVVLVSLPGAEKDDVAAVRQTVEDAGASISGTVGVTDAYLDAKRQAEMQGLLDRATPPATKVPNGATPYARAGAVLGRSVVASDSDQVGQPDSAAAALLSGMSELGFVTVDGKPATRASLAVVVAPPAPKAVTPTTRSGAEALRDLALGLDTQDRGTVVAGPSGSAQDGTVISAIRADDRAAGRVSTVDVLETASGRVSVVYALAAQAGEETGQFGTGPGAGAVAPELGAGSSSS